MSLHDHERIEQRLESISDPVGFLVNLFAHAPVGFAVWTAAGTPLLTNKAFMDLFLVEPPPEYNVLTDELLAANGMLALFQRAFRGETVHVPTFWYDPREHTAFQISEGRRVAISMTIFPLFDAAGAIEYVAATYKDDTELALANEQLRESEARRAAVMEAALDAVVVMDHEGRITEFNAAAERTFGHARADILGKPLAGILVPAPLRHAHRTGLQRYLETGEGPIVGKRIEVPALRSDGTEFPAEIAVVRIHASGPPVFTGYIRDITERRRAAEAEILRIAKEAAEEANVELEAFSYSIAHDLRTPLRAINGFAIALGEDYGPQLDDEARDHLDRIASGARRMGQLIDGLLDLAKIAKIEVQRERVDLASLARNIVAHFEPPRVVDWRISDNLAADGDPRLLRSLLENLLDNAWKFTRERSRSVIELGFSRRERAYFVKDNGIGFDMAHATQLFKPFHRLHVESEHGGIGIGLATVERIVRRHGGRIWAESTPGHGATFFFTLTRI